MKQSIQLTLGCNLAIGEVTLNEIVYELKEFSDCVMLKVLEKVQMSYDDLIAERLSQTTIYGPPARKGLGRHLRKGVNGTVNLAVFGSYKLGFFGEKA